MNLRPGGVILSGLFLACLAVLAAACSTQPVTPSAQPALTQIEGVSLPEANATGRQLYLPNVNAGGAEVGGAEVGGAEEQVQVGTSGPEPTLIPPDPRIEIRVSAAELAVGEVFTITGTPVEIGLPYYELKVRDEGVQEIESMVRVTYENQLVPLAGASQVVELMSAQGNMDQVVFVLRTKAAGVTTVSILATGEVHWGYPGPATWAGAGSGSITITVW